MTTMTQELSWMIGGPQGSGVETAANIFSAVCAANGCHIFGKREYHSNIKGLHSYFVIRASEDLIRSNVSGVDFMASYDAETIFRHSSSVKPGGTILYDSKLKDVAASDVPTLDEPSLQILQERYGLEDVRVQNVLESAKTAYPVSLQRLIQKSHDTTFSEETPSIPNDAETPMTLKRRTMRAIFGLSRSFARSSNI